MTADVDDGRRTDPPPRKKRRFFADAEPSRGSSAAESSSPPPPPPPPPLATNGTAGPGSNTESTPTFATLFQGVFGHVDATIIKTLEDASGGDSERAINMYLDGSWQAAARPAQQPAVPFHSSSLKRSDSAEKGMRKSQSRLDNGHVETNGAADSPEIRARRLQSMPDNRYIGAFGIAAWATRSGSNLLKHGETVRVERQKIPQKRMGRGGKPIPMHRQKTDVIVRITNSSGSEVGRLVEDSAAWVSSLIDQRVCTFEGTCVYAPASIRINDTIFVQLRAFLRRDIFQSLNLLKPQEDNRATGFFEEKETVEEQALRLRQVSLVRLFQEINLEPEASNAQSQKEKREGILKAAENAEEQAKDKENKTEPSPSESEEEEGKELEQDQLDSLYKKAQSFDFNTPEREPAVTFVLDLRKYQKQALHWMVSKENDERAAERKASMHPLWEEYKWPTQDMDGQDLPVVEAQQSFYLNPYSGELSLDFPAQEHHCLGGILADEMGLGKTIEMLSLIHTNPSDAQLNAANNTRTSVNDLTRPVKTDTIEPAPCTTLVIAPMSLLTQWESEAKKASAPGTLRTMVYYGADKNANLPNLCCESNAASAPNVIVTSYGVVLSEFNQVVNRGGNRAAHGGIFSVEFHRIILDEAHFIKNRQSKTAKACYDLAARHRWVLTGTPIVNRLEDLFSLVRFLRVDPWSNFSFWKTFITVPFEGKDFIRALNVVQTVLEPLVMRRTKDMKTPDGSALVPLPPRTIDIEEIELSKSEQEVYDWIFLRAKQTFNANMAAGTLLKSYTTIFAQLLRLRQACCDPTLTRNKDVLADEEEAAAAADVANGLADNMDLTELIERFSAQGMEQDANKFGAHVLKQIQDEVATECPICAEEPMIEPVVTSCWHSACMQCLLDYIQHQTDKHEMARCFNCREPINQRDLFAVVRHEATPPPAQHPAGDEEEDLYSATPPQQQQQPNQDITLRRIGSMGSAKVMALLAHIKRLRRSDPGAKCVVFSQFTSFLDIVGAALDRERIGYLRFDGTTSQKQRAAVLQQFAVPNGARPNSDSALAGTGAKGRGVLLLSLRAGGVGLNLTMAREVFMLDPWWSWAVESQAIDRVHRMGQMAAVRVTRFIVKGSVEQRMLRVQERKKFM